MNKRGTSLLIFVMSMLAGCTIGYQALGSLSDVPGEMRGKAFPGNASGGGRFELTHRDGRLNCDGQLFPADTSPMPGRCAGETGKGTVRCSDGRELSVRWRALTCRSFEGSGEDKSGNRLVFRVERRQ